MKFILLSLYVEPDAATLTPSYSRMTVRFCIVPLMEISSMYAPFCKETSEISVNLEAISV